MTQELTLPLDLEREIFETAAYRDRAMIPTLLLVCHRVHAWQPLLYRVFTLTHGAENLWSAIESAIESKPANFFHTAVRHVWVSSVSKRTSLVKNLLEHCSGITNLCMDDPLDSDLLPALSAMRLQRFAFTLPLPPPLRLDHPLFLSVTHLDIYDETFDDVKNWKDWSHLASLPALTHVCLSEEMAKAILAQLVAECRNLLIVLVIADINTLTVTDPRVVVASLDYAEDWTKGAWGGDDMWVRAERSRHDAGIPHPTMTEASTSHTTPTHCGVLTYALRNLRSARGRGLRPKLDFEFVINPQRMYIEAIQMALRVHALLGDVHIAPRLLQTGGSFYSQMVCSDATR
ncbi:hypothetical protein FB451DRAFT_1412890 [Mycena latifolia]|nr:hypothetical protein FB451DRAFT_1412890 [Mycena latifolia]